MMPSKICTPDTTELSEDEKAENTAEEEEAEAEQTGDGDGDGGDGADAADAADGSDAADAAEAAEALDGLEDVAEVVVIVTVICTELHRQGRMPEHIFQADERFTKALDTSEYGRVARSGYLLWGRPVVRAMRASSAVSDVVETFAMAKLDVGRRPTLLRLGPPR